MTFLVWSGFTIEKTSMYGKEACDGWEWNNGRGQSYSELGIYEELPPIPEELIEVADNLITKYESENKIEKE